MAVAILPCAGSSRRMGRPKLLLPYRHETVIGSVVSALDSAGITELVVVMRPVDQALQAWCSQEDIQSTVNPDPSRGMLSSVWEGLKYFGGANELLSRGEDLLVCPGDHPGLKPSSLQRLKDHLKSIKSGLVLPTFRGRRGHPLLISRDLTRQIELLDLKKGLKALLELYPDQVHEVEIDDPATLLDLDSPADYERLVREF